MLSYAAYCATSDVLDWDCYWCEECNVTSGFKPYSVIYNATTNILAFVGYMDTDAYVVFRGTQPQSIKDWIEDIEFGKLEEYPSDPNAMVHGGFYGAYLSIQPALISEFQAMLQWMDIQPTNVYFTGHSLGAALAELAAVDFLDANLIPYGVTTTSYNYGCPRVGNQYFAEYYNGLVNTTYRVVNKADLVPHVPLETMGFYHVAREVWYASATAYTVCDSSGEDPKCSDSLLFTNIIDHMDYEGHELIHCVL